MRRSIPAALDVNQFPLTLAGGLRASFADIACESLPDGLTALMRRLDAKQGEQGHGPSAPKAYKLTAALLEDEQLDIIECESAEAALAVMLMHERDVSMIFADVRLTGAMDGVDLAWEVRQRWPRLPVVLTSGQPCERVRELPPGVAYVPKPWQPLNVLMVAEQALAYVRMPLGQ